MGILLSLGLFFSAVIVHEFSHAFVAHRLGDDTAKRMGRMTLNPIAHIDLFGTILLPLMLVAMHSQFLFGYAKPVPINFAGLRNPKKDMIWVGLAGPLSNLLCAAAASMLIRSGLKYNDIALSCLQYFMAINVILAVFNLIPIPPLDGSRVLMGLVPIPLAVGLARLERYGFIIVFALLYMGIFDRFVLPVSSRILDWMTRI